MLTKINVALQTRYKKTSAIIHRFLDPNDIEEWGKVKILNGGDTINASSLVKGSEDRRNASYVRVSGLHCSVHDFVSTFFYILQYQLLVDKRARNRQKDSEFVGSTFYGELQRIFVVKMPGARALGLTTPETLILAVILNCKIVNSHPDLDIHFYEDHGRTEVVDITTIQCLVGRFKDRKVWAVIDRSGGLARATFDLDG